MQIEQCVKIWRHSQSHSQNTRWQANVAFNESVSSLRNAELSFALLSRDSYYNSEKVEKKNYTNVKTYKSIVLLNTLEKILKSVIARRINDLTKTHDLLFVNQMNERKNRSCETVLKLLTKQIHTIWNMSKDKITTLLKMNVIEAYDHISRERLLHNLKKRRISTWIVTWTNNFM
jgi:hypothetical protein